MTEGMRAGAGVLLLVTAIVIGLIVRFGYRLWAADLSAVALSAKVESPHTSIAPERRA